MLRVAICDDSALERDILADFLSHYCNAHAIDYSYKMYDSGEPLYYELGDGGWFDIILLDRQQNRKINAKIGVLHSEENPNNLSPFIGFTSGKVSIPKNSR